MKPRLFQPVYHFPEANALGALAWAYLLHKEGIEAYVGLLAPRLGRSGDPKEVGIWVHYNYDNITEQELAAFAKAEQERLAIEWRGGPVPKRPAASEKERAEQEQAEYLQVIFLRKVCDIWQKHGAYKEINAKGECHLRLPDKPS